VDQGPAFPELPEWIREALALGEPTGGELGRRVESRKLWALCCALGGGEGRGNGPDPVRVNNLCSRGIGLLSLKPAPVGAWAWLAPVYISHDPPVWVRVVHSTRTIQGYHIGCVLALHGARLPQGVWAGPSEHVPRERPLRAWTDEAVPSLEPTVLA